MSAPLRLALAGLGARGAYWREVIARDPRTRAVAYVDSSDAARERVAEAEPEVARFTALEDALDAVDVDAIVLATPPDTRTPHVALACERGLPLLVEKPLALELSEAARHVATARAAGVPLMIGLNFRYLHVTRAARRLLGGDALGAPAFARFSYERWRDGHRPGINRYPLAMAQPMLWEQSIHHVDLLRFVYEREIVRLWCRTWNPPWSMYAGDANVSAILEMEGGLTVNYHGTWQANHVRPAFEWRTECARGALFQRDQFGDLAWAERARETPSEVPLPPHETWVTDTAGVLDAFVRHLVDGDALECSGADHLRSLAVIEACARSSSEGVPVAPGELLAAAEASAAEASTAGAGEATMQ